jgi:hypothetical protein
MKSTKDLSGARKLTNIAATVERLAIEASQEPQTYLIAGRLARAADVWTLPELIVHGMKCGDPAISALAEAPMGRALLHEAMWVVSKRVWEKMLNNAHPEQFGWEWERKIDALKSAWREKVREMIEQCQQGGIFAVTDEDYFHYLTAAGESEEVAQVLADWISDIKVGDTPST